MGKEPFEAGYCYHIYNRGVGTERIFYNDYNYQYFLKLFQEKLSPYLDVFCYCLIPNHFHFFVRVKNDLIGADGLVGEAFRKFSISYVQALNSQENRKGSLFMKPFRRKRITSDQYFTAIIAYIHFNPVRHKLTSDFADYRWSSYRSFFSSQPSLLLRDEVIEWFGDIERFKQFHLDYNDIFNEEWMIE